MFAKGLIIKFSYYQLIGIILLLSMILLLSGCAISFHNGVGVIKGVSEATMVLKGAAEGW